MWYLTSIWKFAGLNEIGISFDEALDFAAMELLKPRYYCKYLMIKLATAYGDSDSYTNSVVTIFSDTWYPHSLSLLGNADLANTWKLADYFMIADEDVKLLVHVAAQRQLRSHVPNFLLHELHQGEVQDWVTNFKFKLPYAQSPELSSVCAGVRAPSSTHEMVLAAAYGHLDTLIQAHTAGCEWTSSVLRFAAGTGRLHLVQRLREEGCPWDTSVLMHAICTSPSSVVLWLLHNGAPRCTNWYIFAADKGRTSVLRQAYEDQLLSSHEIASLRAALDNPRRYFVLHEWNQWMSYDGPCYPAHIMTWLSMVEKRIAIEAAAALKACADASCSKAVSVLNDS